ncbi:heat shock protein Hsp20 [Oleidesulfovibrio alaskensis G20]|jgi:HSP20 family protein|uniref:Heat shock protein Hsp20 n=1 Tax=Oleidesulfovibrio alaskensis (strain ATCC BAA-1058 / DSM 17464 / G20) TaxID=207559 RepID=Q30WR0_OLEA2|nr:Hsp20/alpha crystallin family protein [Oleidesulfovibrio alaskensis]ABB39886.1 heat shock protein Hsp20 [Oleidesulfovibrio alaskensis G20]MBG0773603.1 Hsp20/alpha crystallin family protein [Oleidesulfovibrio alaskensis]MBL3582094.1 Hsp20/alpha crystallin family protein [Oleidesulfovibrio alaskensis]
MAIDFSSFYEFPHLLDRMTGEMDHAFAGGAPRQAAFPPLNIGEDDSAVYVRALVPGAGMDDLELIITDKTLSLKGELKPVQGRYYRQERPTGPFQRVITVGVPIDRDAVRATLRNGVLEVVLPKHTGQRPQTIRIDIR